MKRTVFGSFVFFSALILFVACSRDAATDASLFTVELRDGVKIIRNHGPQLGEAPGARLELVGKIGKLEGDQEKDILYDPVDAARLSNGDILILEKSGCCVKRYDKGHAFISSFGRKGQGPGDFQSPFCLRLNGRRDKIYVGDYKISLLSLDGSYDGGFKPERIGGSSVHEEFRTSGMAVLSGSRVVLPSHPSMWAESGDDKLLSMYDEKGAIIRSFGEVTLYDHPLLTLNANIVFLAADRRDNLYVAYAHRNKISRYSPDGKLIFSSERPLPYEVKNTTRTEVFQSGDMEREISWPSVTSVTKGIAVDREGRIWVWTFLKQPNRFLAFGEGQTPGDCYAFDVFDAEGIFLFRVPFPDVWADRFSIYDDRMYLIDSREESCVYEYRILKEDSSSSG